MKIIKLTLGMLSVNCYLVMNEETKEMIIIDPGDECSTIVSRIRQLGAAPLAILLTHGHFDHMGAVIELRKIYDIPCICGEKEREVLLSPEENLSGAFGSPISFEPDRTVKDGETLDIAGFEIKVFETPGHTKGGVCYYFETQDVLFSGDTLFRESVGRSDFPGGSASSLIRSIKEKLMPLEDDTSVCPGHNEDTTIGFERMYNPWL